MAHRTSIRTRFGAASIASFLLLTAIGAAAVGGAEGHRSAPSSRPELQIENLPVGSSRIDMQARRVGSDASGWTPSISARLDVAPLPSETWWMKALAALGIVALAALLFRLQLRAVTLRAALLEEQLQARTGELREANGRLEIARIELAQLASHDALTGLFNRRAAEERLKEAVALARRQKTEVGILLFDLDNFKHVNDMYGHRAGDLVLVAVAACVRHELRDSEFLARFGGEEFIVLFQGEDELGMHRAANRVREAVAALSIDLGSGYAISVTISGGVASTGAFAAEATALLATADKALYVAKREGRNRILRASRLVRWGAISPLRASA